MRKQLGRQNRLWLIALLLATGGCAFASASLKQADFESIKAKEVVVVDENGTVRARQSGDMRDAVMANGHIAKRGSKAAGLMIYSTGWERVPRAVSNGIQIGKRANLTAAPRWHEICVWRESRNLTAVRH